MIQKTIYLRQFNECDDELKEKILNNYRFINVEDISLDEMDEAHYCNLEIKGFKNPKIYYDFSYCQGCGACFDCENFDFTTILENENIRHKTWLVEIIENYCKYGIFKSHNSNLYCHSKTRFFEMYLETSKNYPHIEKYLSKIEEIIEEKRYNACECLYNDLMTDFEYWTSDEAIIETLNANEYYFNDMGKIEHV